jgi:hypothetical protein
MPYKVTLVLASGQKIQRTEIERGPTPNIRDIIRVDFLDGVTTAHVTGVRKGQLVDEVDAQEM